MKENSISYDEFDDTTDILINSDDKSDILKDTMATDILEEQFSEEAIATDILKEMSSDFE
ncbi:9639_t:CDS:1, partial [Racocetra fulgida]